MSPEADTLLERTQFLEINEIFLRDVVLPEGLQKSMVEKNQQEQMAEEYKYRIEREEQEAKRKRIEAQGIRDFANIVKDGISDRYLMWRGIDATLALAQSNNSKVIVVGSGKTGLPILLGNLDSTIVPPATPAPSSNEESKALAPLTNNPDESTANRYESPQTPSEPLPPVVTDSDKAAAPPAVLPPPAAKPSPGAAKNAR